MYVCMYVHYIYVRSFHLFYHYWLYVSISDDVFVCMFVCIFVCVYVCVCMYECLMYECMYVCMYVCMYQFFVATRSQDRTGSRKATTGTSPAAPYHTGINTHIFSVHLCIHVYIHT